VPNFSVNNQPVHLQLISSMLFNFVIGRREEKKWREDFIYRNNYNIKRRKQL
jgi:hypothetical protein